MRVGAARTIVIVIAVLGLAPASAAAWSPGAGEGKLAFGSAEGGQMHIWTVNPDGSGKRQVTDGADADTDPAFSPSGRTIAFTRSDPESSTGANITDGSKIWTVPVSGGAATQLTTGLSEDSQPAWSPSGARIAFVRSIGGVQNLWTMAADGSDQVQLTDLPGHTVMSGPTYTPDGSKIIFSAFPGNLYSYSQAALLYEITTGGASMHAITPFDNTYDVTPDIRSAGLAGAPALEMLFTHNQLPSLKIAPAGGDFPVDEGTAIDTTSLDPVGAHTRWARWSPVANPTPSNRFAYLMQRGDTVPDVSIFPTGQVTWDGAPKQGLSWAPALTIPHGAGLGSAGIVVAPSPHHPIASLFAHCPGSAGRQGCTDLVGLLIARGGPRRRIAQRSIHLKAGTTKLLTLKIPRPERSLVLPGHALSLRLEQKSRGHTTQRVIGAGTVELAATVTETCPAAGVAGTPVSFNGGVHAASAETASAGTASAGTASAGTASAAAAAGRRVTLIATGPAGEVRTAVATIRAGGLFTVPASFDIPGTWTIAAVWGGDAKHASTTSRACALTISPAPPPPPPPPIATTITATCPGTGTVKGTLTVSGTIAPAFAGAPITVTYTLPAGAPTPTITDQATTDATGTWTDSVTTNTAGDWSTQASFAGDAGHLASTSPACATTVDP
jgi:hypothetical protein